MFKMKKKMDLDLYLATHKIFNFKRIIDPNVKAETIKIIEKNREKSLGFGNNFYLLFY